MPLEIKVKAFFTRERKEVAVGERIAYWIRTPQVPGSRPGWYGTFYWASDCWPPWQHQVERSLVCVEGRGRISRSGLTQDIKLGSCVFQCDVPHRWIAQRQVGPVSVYCDGVGCPVLVSAAWHFCVAAHWSKYHCYKQAPSWYDLRCFKATLNPNKQTNTRERSRHWTSVYSQKINNKVENVRHAANHIYILDTHFAWPFLFFWLKI